MGGSKTQVVQAPTTPAPSASESSADLMKAQLQYNPELYKQYAQSYQQYLPQLTQSEFDVQKQFAPQMKQLQESMYPQQTQLVEALSGQALQRLNNPYGYSSTEQSALDAIRQRQREQLSTQLRERANLSGGLYGGRAANTEQQGLTELEQAFADQDINRQLQASQQALQYTTPALQIQYPQIQQAQTPNYWQGVTPSADALYNAMYGASQPDSYLQQGQPSPLWGLAGSVLGGVASGFGAGAGSSMFSKSKIG